MRKKCYILFLMIAVLMLSACAPNSNGSKEDHPEKNQAENNTSKEDSPEVTKDFAENIDFLEYGKIMKPKMEAQHKLEETLKTMTISEIKEKAERGELDVVAIVADEYLLNNKVENILFTAEYMKNPLQREEIIEKEIRSLVMISEAKRLGLDPTKEQVDEFIKEILEDFSNTADSPDTQKAYKMMEQIAQGLEITVEQYMFETTREAHYNACIRKNLFDRFQSENPNAKREDFEAHIDELVKQAQITRFTRN